MHITPQITRRLALAGAALAILLTGCGSESDAQPAESGQATETGLLPEAEGTTQYPLTLETPFGDTELPQRPERIAVVTASTVDTDALLALGVVPVLAPSTVDRNPWLEGTGIERVEKLWDSDYAAEVDAETVAAVKPDLIVSLDADEAFDQSRFDQLSAIAPVLHAETGQSWPEMTRSLGQPLDLAAKAEETVATAQDTVAAAAAEHPEFKGRTATHVIIYGGEFGAAYASYPGSDTAALFEGLGFVLPDAAGRFADADTVSTEQAGLIDADFLLLSTFDEGSDEWLEQKIVQQVPAVAEGRAVINPADPETGTNSFAWALNVQSALSVPWMVDQLATFGAEALGEE